MLYLRCKVRVNGRAQHVPLNYLLGSLNLKIGFIMELHTDNDPSMGFDDSIEWPPLTEEEIKHQEWKAWRVNNPPEISYLGYDLRGGNKVMRLVSSDYIKANF